MKLTALFFFAATLAQGQTADGRHILISSYSTGFSVPLTCDQQYALTTNNLRDASDVAWQDRPAKSKHAAVSDARAQVFNMSMYHACTPADLTFLTAIDALLYRAGLALPPDQAEAKRKADAAAEQARVIKQLRDALEGK